MTQVQNVPTLRLNDGREIPQLGFGVFQVPPAETEAAVTRALEVGYRHIDTAAAYRNEAGVARAIAAVGLNRSEVFITTKLFNDDHGREQAQRAFAASLERLETDYVDLYLIHWPVPSEDRYVETWQALGEFHREGRARSIGVSNFNLEHLERLGRETETMPAVNQVELHPYLAQRELRAYQRDHGIATEAWSPIGQGGDVLDDPAIGAIAESHDRSPAQVIIRWHLQSGNIVIPKSVTPERIAENFRAFDFELSDAEMAQIDGLDRDERLGPDPATFVRP
ncbi:MAG TPA: aldo/keto reductase [Solirubrobacteraceae bacterium]|jgi:diketogulonate reductase-like aldo/keto reductase|nr:aldo/keto reductase [Solirubrobacteraceae bacterium]